MSYRLTGAQLHAPPHRRPVTALKKPKGLGGAARGALAALGCTNGRDAARRANSRQRAIDRAT